MSDRRKTFKRTEDVLDNVRAFHREVSAVYGTTAASTSNERVRMFLSHLENLERGYEAEVDSIMANAPRPVLDSWLQYSPAAYRPAVVQGSVKADAPDVDDVLCAALSNLRWVIGTYQGLADSARGSAAREMFSQLVVHKLEQQRRVAGLANEITDL